MIEEEQQIKNFTAYANFIASEFDINVILDTNHARTDGADIYLPNVSNLTDNELDAMYAILLHEAGHIRYSIFDDSYFSQFDTELIAFFANCFEDARIENLLCKDFNGARQIFENLYINHAVNPDIKQRLFGVTDKVSSVEFSFGAFMHNMKCEFDTADLLVISPNAKSLIKFLSNNQSTLEELQKMPLVTPQDSINLALAAHQLFLKKYKDNSAKISYTKDKAILETLEETLEKNANAIENHEKEYQGSLKSVQEKHNLYKKSLEPIQAQVSKFESKLQDLDTLQDFLQKLNTQSSLSNQYLAKIKRANTAIKSVLPKQSNILGKIKKLLKDFEKKQQNIQRKGEISAPYNHGINPKTLKEQLETNPDLKPFDFEPTGNEKFDKDTNAFICKLKRYIKNYQKNSSFIKNKKENLQVLINEAETKLKNFKSVLQELNDPSTSESHSQFEMNESNADDTVSSPFTLKNLSAKDTQVLKECLKENNLLYKTLENIFNDEKSKSFSSMQTDTSEAPEDLKSETNFDTEKDNDNEDFDIENDAEDNFDTEKNNDNEAESSDIETNNEETISSQFKEASKNNANLIQKFKNKERNLKNALSSLLTPTKQFKLDYEEALKNKQDSLDKLNSSYIQMFDDFSKTTEKSTHNSQVQVEHPLDLLFNETPGWEKADEYQRKFDKNATHETKTIVVNGEKLGGTRTGARSVSVLLKAMRKDVIDINLNECFKDVIAGSLLDQKNDAGFEHFSSEKGKAGDSDSYVSKLLHISKHIPLTTDYDKIEMMITNETGENQIQKILADNIILKKRVSEELKKKMKVSKKAHYVGSKDEGDLDSRNLWKIASRRGSDVFEQNEPKFINKVAASILVDISGSLNNSSTNEGKELKLLTTLLSTALDDSFVKHEVLGYHAPYSPELNNQKVDALYNRKSHYLETIVFRKFGQKSIDGLNNLEIQSSDNSDGESLRICTKRLLKQPAKNRIIFLITDAKPFLTGTNIMKLDKDLYLALQEAKSKKIQVVGIGFNADKNGLFGKNYIQIKDNSYNELIDGIKNLKLNVD